MTTEEIKEIGKLLDKAYEKGFEAGVNSLMSVKQVHIPSIDPNRYSIDPNRYSIDPGIFKNVPLTVSDDMASADTTGWQMTFSLLVKSENVKHFRKDKIMFTELEKTILDATDLDYSYITRDRDGSLYLSVNRPYYSGPYLVGTGKMVCFNAFDNLFKDVKSGGKPIRFRKPILDDIEREYLKTVFKPFHNRIKYVEKDVPYAEKVKYYIWACVDDDDNLEFPRFDKGSMYKGMKTGQHYTLKELGIAYD